MKNISEYDERQLTLMQKVILSFENKEISLDSLIGSLEFLFNVLESVEEDFEEDFSEKVCALETINAVEIMKRAGEDISGLEFEEDEKKTSDQ